MNIKKIVTISLFVFGALVIIILGAGLYFNQKPAPTQQPVVQQSSDITSQQVSLHNSENDCWVIVEGKVYNVTTLIPTHSGGSDKIIPNCGKDATTAFTTRGGKGPHPQEAQETLNSYYVGKLN
jgi:cytochrome b involved in lipid metabolism